jgi:hypothetical protein
MRAEMPDIFAAAAAVKGLWPSREAEHLNFAYAGADWAEKCKVTKQGCTVMSKFILLSGALVAIAGPAMASVAAPGPIAGAALGPIGLAVAAAGYVAYRVIKARSDR